MESRARVGRWAPRGKGADPEQSRNGEGYLCEKVRRLWVRRIGINLHSNWGGKGREGSRNEKASQTLQPESSGFFSGLVGKI